MASSRTRLIASLLSDTNTIKTNLNPSSGVTKATTYSSIDLLPLSSNVNGDQAFVSSIK